MIPLLPVVLSDDMNFLIHPIAQTNLTLFAHIIYYDTTKVLVQNITDQPLRILRCQSLDHVVDICYNHCFFADAKSGFNLATVLPLTAPLFEH